MRKVSFIALLMFISAISFGQKQLTDFDKLMESLNKGQAVKAVFHYAKCQLISDNEISKDTIDAVGGMQVETYEYFAKGAVRNKQAFVVFSESKLIKNPLAEGHVLNYVKVKVTADNKVRVTAEYIDPKTYEVGMTENFFGDINDQKNESGVFFYLR